jgi:hypothetical protein
MSKNQTPETNIVICQPSDLSAAIDALRAEMGDAAPSKSAMLNILAASLCGPRRNWGFIKTADKPVVAQRTEPNLKAGIAALIEARPELAPEKETFEDIVISEAYDAFVVAFENDSRIQDAKSNGSFSDEMLHTLCQSAAEFFAEEWAEDPFFKDKVLSKGPDYIMNMVADDAEKRLREALETMK